MPCAFIAAQGAASSLPRPSRSFLAMASSTGGRAAIDGGDRERGAPFIVDRCNHAVILQLELLIEREPRQRALLADGEATEDRAGDCDSQGNRQDQAGGNRSKREHGTSGTPGISAVRKLPEKT